MSTVVLSVRVRRELREESERLGVDIRAVVERALEAMDVSAEEWVRAVREARAER